MNICVCVCVRVFGWGGCERGKDGFCCGGTQSGSTGQTPAQGVTIQDGAGRPVDPSHHRLNLPWEGPPSCGLSGAKSYTCPVTFLCPHPGGHGWALTWGLLDGSSAWLQTPGPPARQLCGLCLPFPDPSRTLPPQDAPPPQQTPRAVACNPRGGQLPGHAPARWGSPGSAFRKSTRDPVFILVLFPSCLR